MGIPSSIEDLHCEMCLGNVKTGDLRQAGFFSPLFELWPSGAYRQNVSPKKLVL